jgi:hypothetical protein
MDDIRRLLESFDRSNSAQTEPVAQSSTLEESLWNDYDAFLDEQALPRSLGRGLLRGMEQGAAEADARAAAAARRAQRSATPKRLPQAEIDRELQALANRQAGALKRSDTVASREVPPTRSGAGKQHSPKDKGKGKEEKEAPPKRKPQKGDTETAPRMAQKVAEPTTRARTPAANEPLADVNVIRQRPRPAAAVKDAEPRLMPSGGTPVTRPSVPEVVRTRRAQRPEVKAEPTPQQRSEPAPTTAPEIARTPQTAPSVAPRATAAPAARVEPGPRPAAQPDTRPAATVSTPEPSDSAPRLPVINVTGTRSERPLPPAGSKPTFQELPRVSAGGGGDNIMPPGPPGPDEMPRIKGPRPAVPLSIDKSTVAQGLAAGAAGAASDAMADNGANTAAVSVPTDRSAAGDDLRNIDLPPTVSYPRVKPAVDSGGIGTREPETMAPSAAAPSPEKKGSYVRVRTPQDFLKGGTTFSGALQSRFGGPVRTGVLEHLKEEYRDFINEQAQVIPITKKTAAGTAPSAAGPAASSVQAPATKPVTRAPGAQLKGELRNPWNRGIAALGAYDEYTRRRGQPEWKRLAGAAMTGAGEYLGAAGGATVGTVGGALAGGPAAPLTAPAGGIAGGVYGAVKGYEAGQKLGDRLLGSPGEEAVGDVSKKAAELAEPVGRAIGRGISGLKRAPGFTRDDQSYI